ncbi:RNA polymerase sigma 70 [Streptomyces sp. 150FB]|uniref:sigma-70 family RNA polymerase sigma factor n=1 Tax=Streptomyces sp. 150FB TaxID=1576605 RepID=UPI0005891916|nr:sigma-70 family RNA polymerase sigma factor [Streptomyces sp. 150FB]KIF78200.1 RNA polymerase sigma 70 [Streptomyces sp. 150FB]
MYEQDGPGGHDALAERFEAHRGRLRGVAYRMLGSASEADDAVQEAWLKLSRVDPGGIGNLTGWLTTVVSRVCLDMLRSRRSRPEEPIGQRMPDDIGAEAVDGGGPEDEAVLIESVGRALLVVLDRLGPAERIAFVLHDMFAVPFDEIAPIVDRTPVATKKLASRARLRVRGNPVVPGPELDRHREVVEAFLAAARGGDLDALLGVLAPDVVRRSDPAAVPPGAAAEARGARTVARETVILAGRAQAAALALVNGTVGIVVAPGGRLVIALLLTVEDDRIAEYEVIADPARLRALDVAVLGD